MNERELISKNSLTSEMPWGKLTSLNPKFENITLVKESSNIGRQSSNDIQISDIRLSGTHCRIYKDNENNFWIEDFSSNGTFLENELIGKGNKRKIFSGDKIYFLHPNKLEKKDDALGYVFSSSREIKETIQKRMREEDKKALEHEKKLVEKNLKFQEELGEEMKCCICIDYIYQCVTLIPCLHNFCAACFSEWMEKSNLCPQCREEATELKKNHIVNNIIEKFLVNNPDKKRSPQEYEDMDKKNKLKEDRLILKKPEDSLALKQFPFADPPSFLHRPLNTILPPPLFGRMPLMNMSPLTSIHNSMNIPQMYQFMNSTLQNNFNVINNSLALTSQLLPNLSNLPNISGLLNNIPNFNINFGNGLNNNNNPYFQGPYF